MCDKNKSCKDCYWETNCIGDERCEDYFNINSDISYTICKQFMKVEEKRLKKDWVRYISEDNI